MRRVGFTLLEIMIVIIIIAILATMGIMQYNAVVERARGAEARQILGQLRSVCAGIYMGSENTADCAVGGGTPLGIGAPGGNLIPNACAAGGSHFFSYAVQSTGAATMTFTATRCLGATGKSPGYTGSGANPVLQLQTDYSTGGTDTWVPGDPAY